MTKNTAPDAAPADPAVDRDRIAAGLTLIALQLANFPYVPDGWERHEWAYVRGLASAEVLFLRDRLVPPS